MHAHVHEGNHRKLQRTLNLYLSLGITPERMEWTSTAVEYPAERYTVVVLHDHGCQSERHRHMPESAVADADRAR